MVLVGGEYDGDEWVLDDDPGRPRPAWLVHVAPPLWQWRDLVVTYQPVPCQVGVYELKRAPDGRPVRDDQGRVRYVWKGIQ
jgi:hypothetical protein